MGLFKDIFSSVIGDAINKSISNTVNASAREIIEPVEEKLAEETAKNISSATAQNIYSTVLANFPKWTYSAIEEVSTSEEDDYIYVMVGMKLEDDTIEKYQNELKQNGFTGDWQIMGKKINGKDHKIDFTFVSDAYINYYIFK